MSHAMPENPFSMEVRYQIVNAKRARIRVGHAPGEHGVIVIRAGANAATYLEVRRVHGTNPARLAD